MKRITTATVAATVSTVRSRRPILIGLFDGNARRIAVRGTAGVGRWQECALSGFFCAFSVSGFPGGTISVDADARQAASPPSDRATAYWQTWGNNGYSCGTGFAETAPMQSWVCHNVPAGTVFAAIEGTPYMAMGLRW